MPWLADWLMGMYRQRRKHFAPELVERGLPLDDELMLEVYEVSEYARQMDAEERTRLFPGC